MEKSSLRSSNYIRGTFSGFPDYNNSGVYERSRLSPNKNPSKKHTSCDTYYNLSTLEIFPTIMECNMEYEEPDTEKCGISDIEINIIDGNPPDWWTRSTNWPPPNGSMSLIERLNANYRNLPDDLKTELRLQSNSADSSRRSSPMRVGPPPGIPLLSLSRRNEGLIDCNPVRHHEPYISIS